MTSSDSNNDYNAYDVGALVTYYATPTSTSAADVLKQNSMWTDWSSAETYGTAIEEACGASEFTDSCYTDGNNWSVIYSLCGVTMCLLALNSAMMILGAWSFHARGLASCCGSLCCCLNFAAIITTGVFRFNNQGNLSALCLAPTKYDSSNDTTNNDWTYNSDAALIVGLWSCQMIFCITSCCNHAYSGKPSEAH